MPIRQLFPSFPLQQNIHVWTAFRGQNTPAMENIHVLAAFRGQNTPAQQNILVLAAYRGQNTPAQQNILVWAANRGQNTAAQGKCPENNSKTRRNHGRREKMSREQQQFREKLQPHRENVLESPTKPGENSDTGKKLLPGKNINSFQDIFIVLIDELYETVEIVY